MNSDTSDDRDLPLAEQVYRRLRREIGAGELRSGQRLRETELAERLNVSRTPIREAIRRLASEGLVEMAASRGMAITSLDRQQVRELYDLRASLEGTAAGMAAQHASAADIAAMWDLLEAGRDLSEPEQVALLNRRFHEAVRDAARNRYLDQALAQLSNSLALLPGTTFEIAGRPQAAHAEHSAVLAAIEARDSAEAEALARRHIVQAGQTRLRMMFGAG
ncbi:GntR family transcriptional regulator [Enterovirga rhinocerotis]|uniref:DNA-binding GntR family transcriptional regulator n=1 Tax=Enterovirga rhinocerotis TaxID=1339210 RepID=A0A4R7BZI8_9HYPH|nr:GntR family transcriptional regulator [Enterovirga rhinocerotis]TDR89637.1 DNA-binding GntR family transcriptional regulator [Enterovirga rhinocerotis]